MENHCITGPFIKPIEELLGSNDQRWTHAFLPQTSVYQKLTPIKTMLYKLYRSVVLNMSFYKNILKIKQLIIPNINFKKHDATSRSEVHPEP